MKQQLEWTRDNLQNLINEARHHEADEAERLLEHFLKITAIALEHRPDAHT